MSASQQPGSGGHKVKVAVRVRPFLPREVGAGAKNHWMLKPKEIVHLDPETQQPRSHKQQFVFDNVFGPDVTTKTVYDEIAAPIVSEAFNGFNGTILCYGQTSSGKTHTLYGNETDPGIITYLAEDIQKRIEFASSEKRRHVIRMNLIEIYNEHVRDLLCSENPIEIVERNGAVVPANAEHMDIVSATDITRAAERLQRERRIGETRMNTQSSRSHTILRMTINTIEEERDFDSSMTTDDEDKAGTEFESPSSSSGTKRIISAVLNFVDLAGSEKASQTGAVGERLREAGHINTSLSALSKVVSQLSKQWELANKKDPHNNTPTKANSTINSVEARGVRGRIPAQYFVSYRDSKLTRILQSSLAGGALIAIICNATPASSEETLGTLRFALSAKEIQTKPQRNLITDKLDKMQYENTIQELRAELFDKNEELRVLKQLLEKTKKEEDAFIDRRQTFHFQTSTAAGPRRLSMIPEKGLHRTLSVGQDASLMDFREAVEPQPLPLPSVTETGEQEIQTDLTLLDEIPIPSKKRKLTTEESASTPVSTLRMQRTMLAVTIEEDTKDWLEEKALLQEEIQLLKKENQDNCSKLENLRSECNQLQTLKEGKANLSKEFETYKEKHFDEIATLKLSKEYEVDLLNQQVVKRDQQIRALKTMSESNEKSEQELGELKSKLLQQTEELELTKEKLDMMEKEMASKVQTTCSIEQQTDEMTVECNCEKPDPQELEELRSLAADFENFKEKHLDEISSLKQSQENEVLLLNQQVVQRDEEIAALKEMSETQDNEKEIITQELCELKTSLSQLAEELLLEKGNAQKMKLELEEASQKPSTISIEQQTDEMIYECNCEKEELRILSADFETFKVQHFNEITSLTRSKENEVTSLTEQLTYRDQEITALKNTSETLEMEQEKVTTELSEMRTKVHQLTSELSVAEGNVEKLKTELEDLRNLAAEFDHFKQQHFEEIESVNNIKQSKESEITSLAEQLTYREGEITALKNTSQTHEMEKEKIIIELSEAMAKVHQLTSDLLLAEGTAEKLKTELEDLRNLATEFDNFRQQHFEEIESLNNFKQSQESEIGLLNEKITILKSISENDEMEKERVVNELCEVTTKLNELKDAVLLAEETAQKLEEELHEALKLQKCSDVVNTEQQTDLTTLECICNKPDPVEVDRINKELQEAKSSYEKERSKLTDEIDVLKAELKAWDKSMADELTEDLKASWKVNKELETKISEMKLSMLEKDSQLSGLAKSLEEKAMLLEEIQELKRTNLDNGALLDNLRSECTEYQTLHEELSAKFEKFKEDNSEEIAALKLAQESELLLLHQQAMKRDEEMKALEALLETREKFVEELQAKLEKLSGDLTLAEEYSQKLKMEAEEQSSKVQKLSTVTVTIEQQTDEITTAACPCIKSDPSEIQQLTKELEDLKSTFDTERIKLSNEIESLQKELKAGEVGDKSTNIKYTEKLKDDLKASWRDNKELETQLSNLKSTLQGKETELSSLAKKLEELVKTKRVPPEEVKILEAQINTLVKEKEALQTSLTEGEKKLQIAEEKAESLQKELDTVKTANVRRAVVNRGNQTGDGNDIIAEVRALKVHLKQKTREHETAQKKIKDMLLEKKNEAKKYEAKDKEKDDTLQEYKKLVEKIQKETESAKGRQVDQGIQCEYIVELLEKSRKGEIVTLPPEYPNIGKLQAEIRQQKSKLFVVEDALAKCKCNVNTERRKRLLGADRIDPADPDLKENSQPDSAGLHQPPQRKYMRMGHASDRKGNGIIAVIKSNAFLPGGQSGSSRVTQQRPAPAETLQNLETSKDSAGSTSASSTPRTGISQPPKRKSSISPPSGLSLFGVGIQTRSTRSRRVDFVAPAAAQPQDLLNDGNGKQTRSGVQTRSRRGETSETSTNTNASNIPASKSINTRSSTKRKMSDADGGDPDTDNFLKWLQEEHK